MVEKQSNWAGSYTYNAAALHYPESVEQVQALVSRSHKVKALGSRHSFNQIADTSGDLISLDRLPRLAQIDSERRTVTVDGGTRYGQLCRQLDAEGCALHNLASLPHISVAGACATATHGSGDRNGNLATAVSAVELIAADGTITVLSRDQQGERGERFRGAVVGLGGLGIVARLTLDIVPAYRMRQYVYDNLPLSQVEQHFDEITGSAYSVSLFTNWQSASFNQVWLKQQVVEGSSEVLEPEPEFFGATLAPAQRHPIPGYSAQACTEQMGIVGPWCERLPHFRMDFTPSSGEELQTEYLLPREHAIEALQAVNRLRKQIAPLLQVSEVRTIAADELWMSPCFRQARVGIHFTWKKNWEAVKQLLPLIEDALAPVDAVPHWGKLFTMSPERVQSLYMKFPDFRRLLTFCDPEGKFRNAFLDRYIFGARPGE